MLARLADAMFMHRGKVMLGWLVLCMSGLVEAIGFGAIANAAHGAGLALGALLGLGAALLYSRPPEPEP